MEINGSISEVSRLGSRPTQLILLNIFILEFITRLLRLSLHGNDNWYRQQELTSGFDSLVLTSRDDSRLNTGNDISISIMEM